MIAPGIGLLLLALVFYSALSQRAEGEISFFDLHAAIIVFGGVGGALLLAIDWKSLMRMLASARDLVPQGSPIRRQLAYNDQGLSEIKSAWRDGRRASVLEMTESAPTPELRAAAEALLNQVTGLQLTEKFGELKSRYISEMQPTVEGWDIVNRLAPSFGMVGTVSGMVQLFRNMTTEAGNLGGAMAMALLATLYGIAFGAAVGGPMASRVNNQLNQRLGQIDMLEQTVAALIEEDLQAASS